MADEPILPAAEQSALTEDGSPPPVPETATEAAAEPTGPPPDLNGCSLLMATVHEAGYALHFTGRAPSLVLPLSLLLDGEEATPDQIEATTSRVRALGPGFTITDHISDANTDAATPHPQGGVRLTIRRTWDFDRPARAALRFQVGRDLPYEHWLIPGVLYDGNRPGSGEYPTGPEPGQELSFREDRCCLPAGTMTWVGGVMLACWCDPVETEDMLGAAWMDSQRQGVLLPASELPRAYRRKFLNTSGPTHGEFTVQATTRLVRTFHVWLVPGGITAYREVFRKVFGYSLDNVRPPRWGRHLSVRAAHLRQTLLLRREDTVGVPTIQTTGLMPLHNVLAGGFTGRNLDIASAFLSLSCQGNYREFEEPGRAIADFFLKARQAAPGNGLFAGEYHLATRTWWGLFPTHRRRVHVRMLGEMALGWLACSRALKDNANPEWLATAEALCDFYLEAQLDNGSFGEWWSLDGQLAEDGGASGAIIGTLLLEMAKEQDEAAYREAALDYADYAREQFLRPWCYYGDTLDARCVDKESAHTLLRFWNGLAAAFPENTALLDECRELACWLLTWVFTWNVPFAPRSFLGMRGFATKGGTTVSVAHHHLDVYGVAVAQEFLRLWKLTGEDFWRATAGEMLRFCTQLTADEEGLGQGGWGADWLKGWQPEQMNHTDWDYLHTAIRGKGAVRNVIAWVPALMLRTLLDLRTEFPSEVHEPPHPEPKIVVPPRLQKLRKLVSYVNPG